MGEASLVETGTFHSIAYRQIKARWKDLGIRDEPNLISNQGSYLSRIWPKNLIMRSVILFWLKSTGRLREEFQLTIIFQKPKMLDE